MQPPLGGIREAALLSDCNEITQMTKFHCEHPYFQGISLAHKVFVNHPEAGTSYNEQWITQVVPTKIRRFLCLCNANQPSCSATAFGPTARASAKSSPHCRPMGMR